MERPARGRGRIAPPRLDRDFAAEGGGWRRAQRVRRMRMTRRGRVTIATAACAAGIAFAWLLQPHEAVRAFGIVQPMPDFDTSPAEVAAPEPQPAPGRVPEDVFAHVPVGREALSL